MDEGALNRQWRRKLSALVALAETYLQCSFQFSFVSTIICLGIELQDGVE